MPLRRLPSGLYVLKVARPYGPVPRGGKFWSEHKDDPLWVCEPKYNGRRCLAHITKEGVTLMSRHQKQITDSPCVASDLKKITIPCTLDGELVSRKTTAIYYVFDIITHGQDSIRSNPLSKRRMILSGLLPITEHVKLCPQWIDNWDEHYIEEKKKGAEGLVLKKITAPYGGLWVKIKSDLIRKGE